MHIADFLEAANQQILEESVAYARTISVLKDESESVLRNHIPKILIAISSDLRQPQGRTASIDKSRGNSTRSIFAKETAAENHGLKRARSGLRIDQVIAEYRVLRSCVLRLYVESISSTEDTLRDVGRFNEAVDQALAESVEVFSREVDQWQQLFLGVLGHDLRGPLNAIALTAELISIKAPPELRVASTTLKRSTRRMASLMDSLLEYNRASLLGGMVIKRVPVNLFEACREEIEIQKAAMPDLIIIFRAGKGIHGEFDASRIREALANLISNAAKHGVQGHPVNVKLESDGALVKISVENEVSTSIASNEIEKLFEPLRRGSLERTVSDRSNLGLSLFIVRQIVNVHGGEVSGSSIDRVIKFTMILPRFAPPSTSNEKMD